MYAKKFYVFIFITLFFSSLDAKIIEVEQLFNKTTTKVKKEELSKEKSFYGKVVIDESEIVDVVTRFDGYVTKLNVSKSFSHVKKNQSLFKVYSDEISSIQKELKIARTINKSLYESTLEKLRTFDISKKEIQRIKRSKSINDGINIYSPTNGIVLKKNINEKGTIKKGNLLYQIANIQKLWFIAKVYQKDLAFIKKGLNAKVLIDGLSKPVLTKVDFIYPILDEKTKTIDVRFILDNKNLDIYPNMFANVKIKSVSKTMLTLPKTAVLTKGSTYYVFKPISKKEFEPIKVEVKRISSSKYEILDGLEENDEVINNALFLLDSDAVTNALYENDEDDDW